MTGLNTLKRYSVRPKAAVGRGGKRGKTSGRGTKGQNARAGHKKRPEIRDVIKKIPKRRGFGKKRSRTTWNARPRATVVTLARLDQVFAAGDIVTPKTLVEKQAVRSPKGKVPIVKILATGEIGKKLSVSGCAISVSAKEAIEKVGGTVTA